MSYRPIVVGEVVVYVDSLGQPHDALVTAIWGKNTQEELTDYYLKIYEEQKEIGASWATDEYKAGVLAAEGPFKWNPPSINCVYVSGDEKQSDPYGRQLAPRATSTVHQSLQSAHGSYWKNK